MKKFSNPYEAGFDAGKIGADLINCNFTWFKNPDMTHEWERGYEDGKRSNEISELAPAPRKGYSLFIPREMNCAICSKKIKNVKLVIDGVTYEVNVCATCLKPYTGLPIIKKIHRTITRKKR